jgi:hypothetical protein
MEKEKYVYHVAKFYDSPEYTTITVTPKNYWERERCVSDGTTDQVIIDFLEDNGFDEVGDSTFEGQPSIEEATEMLESSDLFEYNQEFVDWLNQE